MDALDTAAFKNSGSISILRTPQRHRRFLVFIRCGSKRRPSLFDQLPSEPRNYDVAVNYFAPPSSDDAFRDGAEFVIGGGLSKYHAAKQFLHEGYLPAYDGVYFLDDDVELHFDLSEFLTYCDEKSFAIAQASLTPHSDSAWKITFNHPAFEYRLTNFVEVMAPYFSRRFLMTVVEAFDLSISTYGLDVFWGSQLETDQAAAVIDKFQMSHMKRRDFAEGEYYAYLRSIGVNCFAELRDVLLTLGIDQYQIKLLGGVQLFQAISLK